AGRGGPGLPAWGFAVHRELRGPGDPRRGTDWATLPGQGPRGRRPAQARGREVLQYALQRPRPRRGDRGVDATRDARATGLELYPGEGRDPGLPGRAPLTEGAGPLQHTDLRRRPAPARLPRSARAPAPELYDSLLLRHARYARHARREADDVAPL